MQRRALMRRRRQRRILGIRREVVLALNVPSRAREEDVGRPHRRSSRLESFFVRRAPRLVGFRLRPPTGLPEETLKLTVPHPRRQLSEVNPPPARGQILLLHVKLAHHHGKGGADPRDVAAALPIPADDASVSGWSAAKGANRTPSRPIISLAS